MVGLHKTGMGYKIINKTLGEKVKRCDFTGKKEEEKRNNHQLLSVWNPMQGLV